MSKATLEDIEKMDKEMLSPRDVAPFLGMQAYSINVIAKECPEKLPFPVFKSGNRIKIPRRLFVAAFKGN